MNKKQFIALAELLQKLEPINLRQQDARATPEHRCWETMRDVLADFCQLQNGNFKRERWLDYIAGTCGPNGDRK